MLNPLRPLPAALLISAFLLQAGPAAAEDSTEAPEPANITDIIFLAKYTAKFELCLADDVSIDIAASSFPEIGRSREKSLAAES